MIQEYKENKTMAQQIISELLTGRPLKSKEISETLASTYRKEINPGYVSSILSKISNKEHSDLGRFIKKTREGNTLVYSLVKECLALTEDQAFGLFLKTGKQKYPLSLALKEYPELNKYIEPDKNQDKNIEVCLKYSSKHAISVTASVYAFAFICLVIVFAAAGLCFAAYLFIYPILITALGLAVIIIIGVFLRKQRF